MNLQIKKATKRGARGRLALIGPSGSGKTYSALRIASHMGDKVGVIDTEHGSASKYADRFNFDVIELSSFKPTVYVEAIRALEGHGCDVVVIDSLTHAWTGHDGALAQLDIEAQRFRGNKGSAWSAVTPMHEALVEAMLCCQAHVIATVRSKMKHTIDAKGVVQRVGMGAVQRDGLEYEFDVVGDLDHHHNMLISKTRCAELDGRRFIKPGEDFAGIFRGWLGEPGPEEGKLRELIEDMRGADSIRSWSEENKDAMAALSSSNMDRLRTATKLELSSRKAKK